MLCCRSSIQTQLNRAAAVNLAAVHLAAVHLAAVNLAAVNLAAVRKRGHVGAFVDASLQVRSIVHAAVITTGVFL